MHTNLCISRHSTILIQLWALYSTGRDLTSAKTPKRQLAVEYTQVTGWKLQVWPDFLAVEITDYVHSRDSSSQRVPSGIILNALSVTKKVSLNWMNVLSCIPCTSPAAVITSFVALKAGHSVQTFFFPFAPLTRNKENTAG